MTHDLKLVPLHTKPDFLKSTPQNLQCLVYYIPKFSISKACNLEDVLEAWWKTTILPAPGINAINSEVSKPSHRQNMNLPRVWYQRYRITICCFSLVEGFSSKIGIVGASHLLVLANVIIWRECEMAQHIHFKIYIWESGKTIK